MQKNYTQLLLGLLVGLVVGLLLGRFVFNANSAKNVSAHSAQQNSKVVRSGSNDEISSEQKDQNNRLNQGTRDNSHSDANIVKQNIPQKAYDVLKHIKETGAAPEGYVGGRVFQNRERNLPITDGQGRKIQYQEWDVNPKIPGRNRGPERLVTGSDGRSWYTSDHYNSFTLMN